MVESSGDDKAAAAAPVSLSATCATEEDLQWVEMDCRMFMRARSFLEYFGIFCAAVQQPGVKWLSCKQKKMLDNSLLQTLQVMVSHIMTYFMSDQYRLRCTYRWIKWHYSVKYMESNVSKHIRGCRVSFQDSSVTTTKRRRLHLLSWKHYTDLFCCESKSINDTRDIRCINHCKWKTHVSKIDCMLAFMETDMLA